MNRLSYLPAGPDSARQGADDFLGTGDTFGEIPALAEWPQNEKESPASGKQKPSHTTLVVPFAWEAELFHIADESSYTSVVRSMYAIH